MTQSIHLDTDLGGDIDDLCALAMLLRWEGVELTGITTVAEAHGRRAGYVRRVLKLEANRIFRLQQVLMFHRAFIGTQN